MELIDGRTDKNLWAGNFDGENRDALTLQSEAALAIAKQIQATLTPEETKALARSRPVNPEAYEAYQSGMFIIENGRVVEGNKSDLDKSIEYFERALKIDPKFAPAYAGLAIAYDFYIFVAPPEEMWPKAKEAALKAIGLDNSLANAYFVLADMKTSYEWDWEGGEKAWKRTLEVNPNHAYAHAVYGNFLAGQGRNQEALLHAERARELDPRTLITSMYVFFTCVHNMPAESPWPKKVLPFFLTMPNSTVG
jgi:tetratricopeptide (TPR) repeat protein